MKEQHRNIFELAEQLLILANLESKIEHIEAIYEGGNNQLFHIQSGSQNFVMKKYFAHPEDGRNRLNAEYSFLEMAYKRAPNYVPKPFSKDIHHTSALYEYIDGGKIEASFNLELSHVEQAAQFISELNRVETKQSIGLENASEACFSINEHLNTIEARINELNTAEPSDFRLAKTLDKMKFRWALIKEEVLENCKRYGISTSSILSQDKRIASPSDFGFHNAIIKKDSSVKFIDFEYAGWDDPAKLIGDFFSQVAVPVSHEYMETFINIAFEGLNFSTQDNIRVKLLIHAYKIKWCCIVLNVYLKKSLQRRLFANPHLNIDMLKASQILKAEKILESFVK
jgi:hypothetical protein